MDEPDPKIIDVFMCKLRKKLAEASGGQHYIETVWGRGYVRASPNYSRWQAESDQPFSQASVTIGRVH